MRTLAVLFFFLLPQLAFAGMNGPKISAQNASSQNVSSQNATPLEISLPTQAAKIGIRFFQLVISPIDGPRSPSYPTGSAYGMSAVKKHGAFWGIILTADRLIHEADQPLGPIIHLHNQDRYFDPVERNDFWLSDPKSK